MSVGRRCVVLLALLGSGLAIGLPVATASATGTAAAVKPSAPATKHRVSSPVARTLPFGRSALIPRSAKASVSAPTVPPNETIGVDNNPPPGKGWEYATYYPNSGVSVNQNDVVNFVWNIGSLNGLHTVTFNAATPLYTQDEFPETATDITGAEANNHPACGFDGEAPCVFNGAGTLNSGLLADQPGNGGVPWDFEVKITAAPGNYFYTCLFHPNMLGEISVVTTARSTQAQLNQQAATQLASDNATAFQAEVANNHAPFNAATRTWTVTAGLTAGNVELLEMLPADLPITKGDHVNFVAKTNNEIHTVTFQPGPLSNRYGVGTPVAPYFPVQCDPPGPDVPGGPPKGPYFFPETGCANQLGYEQPFNFHPQGPNVITSGKTTASSGALTTGGNQPPAPDNIPDNFTFTFPNNGKFTYFCKFHLGITGEVHTAGYRTSASDGGIFTFGANDFFGSMGGAHLNKPVVGHAETPDSQGYWEVATDGGVFTFGDAEFLGSMGGRHLNSPVVGIAATPDGGGYWEVAADGGVFTFGDAVFFGSQGATHLNRPVVGIATTPDGGGYWEVASDGGVFTHGDAGFFGSTGGMRLNAPVVGIDAIPDGNGYRMVATDGGIFNFGDARFFGSEGGTHLNAPMVAVSGE